MARNYTNIDQFLRQLDGFNKRVKDESRRRTREMATFAHRTIVDYTPFLTGRLKASWRMGINGADSSTATKGQRTINQARTEGLSTIGRVMQYKEGDDIVISNFVEYANLVEDGGPNNLPRKMMARTIADIYARFGRG